MDTAGVHAHGIFCVKLRTPWCAGWASVQESRLSCMGGVLLFLLWWGWNLPTAWQALAMSQHPSLSSCAVRRSPWGTGAVCMLPGAFSFCGSGHCTQSLASPSPGASPARLRWISAPLHKLTHGSVACTTWETAVVSTSVQFPPQGKANYTPNLKGQAGGQSLGHGYKGRGKLMPHSGLGSTHAWDGGSGPHHLYY